MSSKKVKVEFEIDTVKTTRGGKRQATSCERLRCRRRELLDFARQLARVCALTHPGGLCTVDDVYDALVRLGHASGVLGNAAGSIFRGREWEVTRLRLRSRRRSSRGREIKVWHLASMPGGRFGPDDAPSPYAVVVDDYRPARSAVVGAPRTAPRATEPVGRRANRTRARKRSRSC